jgi:uncharacterized membrane protein (UPF0182 family)
VSDAFEQLQQVRGYYSVPDTLDVDRYQFEGNDQPQDVSSRPASWTSAVSSDSQRNWANDHTVYTHGYGVVAAQGNERGSQGEPSFVVEDIPLQSADPVAGGGAAAHLLRGAEPRVLDRRGPRRRRPRSRSTPRSGPSPARTRRVTSRSSRTTATAGSRSEGS